MEFFNKAHVTQGMQDLISEGVARLAGAPTQAIFHLKQAMGGGKTHLLIGFGLLAKFPALRQRCAGGTLHACSFDSADVAAFNGRNNPDHFFWGEIASQLGKGDQFKAFWTAGPKAPDKKDWLRLFDGGKPILILLDEMPPYFHYLDTQEVGNGTVADIATRAFANLLTAGGRNPTSVSSFRTLLPRTTWALVLSIALSKMRVPSWACRSAISLRLTWPRMRFTTSFESDFSIAGTIWKG